MHAPKTVVIGLDGAHFELIQPWIDEGKLPNIAHAMEQGVSSDLESVLPPVTSPNWKAYTTGKNPGKLGIFWWENIDVKDEQVYYPSARKNTNTEFWEILGASEPVGVLGIPTTYPPKTVDGFVVSGAPDSDDSGYTRPPSIEEELKEEFDYKVTKRNRLSVDRDAAIEEILELIDSRFKAGKALADRYNVDFLQITTFYLNSLHHFLWDDDATLRGWQIADSHLEEFLNNDTNVVLMSDHGSTEIKTVFNVNTWLKNQGYLNVDNSIAKYLSQVGITTDRLIRLAYLLRIPGLAEKFTPDRLLRLIPNKTGEIRRESKTDAVDWQHSMALASGQGPIYLTIDSEKRLYNRVRSEIIDKLERVKDQDGRPIANNVYRGEEIYNGHYMDEAPDIVIDQTNGIHIAGGIGRDEVFTNPIDDGWRAENKRNGLFVAFGPDFGENFQEDLSILDLAPLFLHLHDCSIPIDMDGKVPNSVFADGSAPAERKVRISRYTNDSAEIELIRAIARNSDL